MGKRPTGSPVFDDLLEGGYETGILTTLYGPAGIGKSNLTLLALTAVEGKAIFIDTEGSFSVDRLGQLSPDVEALLDRVILLKAHSFQQQHDIIMRLPEMIRNDVELVVVDGIAAQYRAALAETGKDVNNLLAQQINTLYGIAAEHDIPVLLTSQVYADMEGDGVKVVGGDIVKYSSKCLIELRQPEDVRTAVLVRHRSLPGGRKRSFVIENVGVYEHGR